MRSHGGWWIVAVLAAAGLAASGCGGKSGATPAVRVANAPTAPPEKAAKRLAKILAASATKRHCGPLERLNKRARYQFTCPVSRKVRRSMAKFQVVGVEAYGTGAVVDYKTPIASEGASMVLHAARDGDWAFSRMGLTYDPSAGTRDGDSREGFDDTVRQYLDAVRERDCNAYAEYAVTQSGKPRLACQFEFPEDLRKALQANPGARPRYMGGNERFGFYGLSTRKPKPRFRTITVIRLTDGALQPYLVLDVMPGPAEQHP